MSKLHTRKVAIPVRELVSHVSSTLIPALINILVMIGLFELEKSRDTLILALISALSAVISIIIIHNIIARIPCFRPFKNYEGRWLQIIPDFKHRNLSIIDFNYDKKSNQYFLKGFNFNTELKGEELYGGVAFTAHKFIERDYHDGFYYITNHTIEQKNGMGKIGFTEISYDGLTRATGYFFDASGNEVDAKQYNTIMIKCDKCLARKLFGDSDESRDITKMSPISLAKEAREFVDAEITIYEENQRNLCKSKNRCKFCECNKQQKDVSDNIEQEVEREELSTL